MEHDLRARERGDHVGGQVLHPGRAAARRHDHIGARQRRRQDPAQAVGAVGHDAEVDHLGTRRARHRGERVLVDVPHLARTRRPVGRNDLVAGGDEADARPPHHAQARQAEAGERAEVLGAQAAAAREHRRTASDVLADAQHVLPRRHAALDLDGAVADLVGVLDHHHRVGAARRHAAGGNVHRLPFAQRGARRGAHLDAAGKAQVNRHARRGAEGVGGAHGVTVHVGAIEVRQVARGLQGGRQHAAGRVAGGHALRRERAQGADGRARLVGGDDAEERLQTSNVRCSRHGSSRRTRAR
ncbi:MAG: hypothetical protein U0802_16185 [Candidatus Binatia bacterium]